jgi:hypothetical protein
MSCNASVSWLWTENYLNINANNARTGVSSLKSNRLFEHILFFFHNRHTFLPWGNELPTQDWPNQERNWLDWTWHAPWQVTQRSRVVEGDGFTSAGYWSKIQVVRRWLIALMMEAESTSETSENFYQTTRRNNPEDSHLHTRRRENMNSQRFRSVYIQQNFLSGENDVDLFPNIRKTK